MKSSPVKAGFFRLNAVASSLADQSEGGKSSQPAAGGFSCRLRGRQENGAKRRNPVVMPGLHFQAGVARKTERSKGNPGVVTEI